MNALRIWIPAALALLSTTAWSQPTTSWLTKKDVALRREAGDTAPVVEQLKADTPVLRSNERSGPWVKVETGARRAGWLHMFDLKSQRAGAEGNAMADTLRGVNQLDQSSRGTTVATATAGIRGLDAKDIANAQPNAQALTRAEAWRSGEAEARQFAARLKLASRTVPDLPAPPLPGQADHTKRPGDAS